MLTRTMSGLKNVSLGLLKCGAVQAANAAAAAEGNAMGSANHARIEQSMASLAAAMAAMALFEQVNCCQLLQISCQYA